MTKVSRFCVHWRAARRPLPRLPLLVSVAFYETEVLARLADIVSLAI
jgi:hypothetical protein